MGKRYRTKILEPSLFFVTTTLREWKPLFFNENLRDRVERQLFDLFPVKADALMGYVLMPSHVHLFVGCSAGGFQLAEFMRSFKSLTARKIFAGHGSIWMEGYDDLIIKTEKQFRIKLNYIHENPVRAGLVKRATEWRQSSAKLWLEDVQQPVLTRDWDWMEV